MDGMQLLYQDGDYFLLTQEAANRLFQLLGDFYLLFAALLVVSWLILGVLLWLCFRGR